MKEKKDREKAEEEQAELDFIVQNAMLNVDSIKEKK
jgi:hypothetical protein